MKTSISGRVLDNSAQKRTSRTSLENRISILAQNGESRWRGAIIRGTLFLAAISMSLDYSIPVKGVPTDSHERGRERGFAKKQNNDRRRIIISVSDRRFHIRTRAQLGIRACTSAGRCVMPAPIRCVMHICFFVDLRSKQPTFLEATYLIRTPLHASWCWICIFVYAQICIRVCTYTCLHLVGEFRPMILTR